VPSVCLSDLTPDTSAATTTSALRSRTGRSKVWNQKLEILKRSAVFCFCFLIGCVCSHGFPTEEQIKSQLRRDMTPEEVVALFGEPNSGRPDNCITCTFRYLAPIGSLTVEHEGYIGAEIRFSEGKVRDWRFFTGNPSHDPSMRMQMPLFVKWEFWIIGILIVLGIISGLLLRIVPVGIVKYNDVLAAYAAREIATQRLPSEFHFITHDTTLQEVIDRLGPCSREVRLPVDPESGLGYAFAPTKSGGAAILTFEYHLPYHAAAIVMPEYPFEPQNRIRAVFYRPLQRDLAESRYSER
jgi:hypothetical protein